MTDQLTEPATEGVVVPEETEDDRARMRELDERVEAKGGFEDESDVGTRGGFGSAKTMIAEARKHLGYRETGENDTLFNRWLGQIPGYPAGGFGYPWCHAFLSYCLAHSDNADAGPRTAGCLAGVSWFKAQGRFSSTPHIGDLVYYGAGGGTHVEVVVGITPTSIKTIGGNTSGSLDGVQFFNGDGVYEKTVQRTGRIFGYGQPKYAVDAVPAAGPVGQRTAASTTKLVKPMTTVRPIKGQQKAVNALGHTPALDVDGEWGPLTQAGVMWLQKKIGADVDGEWGQETERLFKAFPK
jgi:hypothetical protein